MRGIFSHSFVRGTFLFFIANLYIGVLNYFFNSQAGKLLGPSGYSEVATLFSYIAILTLPFSIVTPLLIRRLGAAGEDRLPYARSAELWYLSRLRRWWYIALIPFFAIPIIPWATHLSLVTSAALVVVLTISVIGAFYSATMQGLQLFATAAALSVIAVTIKITGIPVANFSSNKLGVILIFFILSVAVHALFTSLRVHQKTILAHPVLVKPLRKRIVSVISSRESILTMLALIGIMLIGTVDVIIVKRMFPSDLAGYYAAWNLLMRIPLYVAGPVISILFIYFSDSTKRSMYNRVLVGVSIAALICSVIAIWGYSRFASSVVHVVFSKEYDPIIPYMTQAAVTGAAFALFTVYSNYLIATRSRYMILLPIMSFVYVITLISKGQTPLSVMNITTFYIVASVGVYIAGYVLSNIARFIRFIAFWKNPSSSSG